MINWLYWIFQTDLKWILNYLHPKLGFMIRSFSIRNVNRSWCRSVVFGACILVSQRCTKHTQKKTHTHTNILYITLLGTHILTSTYVHTHTNDTHTTHTHHTYINILYLTLKRTLKRHAHKHTQKKTHTHTNILYITLLGTHTHTHTHTLTHTRTHAHTCASTRCQERRKDWLMFFH